MWLRYFAIICFAVLAYGTTAQKPAIAQSMDAHQLYETKCAGCHESHAGDFTHKHLEHSVDGPLGRETGVDLRTFLERGHGKLSPTEIEKMVQHLTAVLDSGALFQEKCLICHGRAKDLARSQLIIRNDRLVGRYSGRDIETFLTTHGNLDSRQIVTLMNALKRQNVPIFP